MESENDEETWDADRYFDEGTMVDGEDDQKAIEYYTKAIELEPGHVYAYYNRGLCWEEREESAKAIADFKQFIEFWPANPDGPLELAQLYLDAADNSQQSPEEAFKYASRACQLYAQQPDSNRGYQAHCALAQAYARLNEFPNAVTAIEQAIQLLEENPVDREIFGPNLKKELEYYKAGKLPPKHPM